MEDQVRDECRVRIGETNSKEAREPTRGNKVIDLNIEYMLTHCIS
jgi:hypothetical protein